MTHFCFEYACAEGGAHLPIVLALCLPEPYLEAPGRKEKEEERIMPSLVATTSALAHTHKDCVHALTSD